MNNLAISNFTFGLSDLSRHQEDSARSIERLSTGNQVNRASDNPSGVQSATRLQARENAIIKQLEGFERERGFLGTQEGALSVIADQLIELNAIVVQSADGATLTDDEMLGDGVVDRVLELFTQAVPYMAFQCDALGVPF